MKPDINKLLEQYNEIQGELVNLAETHLGKNIIQTRTSRIIKRGK